MSEINGDVPVNDTPSLDISMDDESMLKLTTQSPTLEPPTITSVLSDKEPSLPLEDAKHGEDIDKTAIQQDIVNDAVGQDQGTDNDVAMEEVAPVGDSHVEAEKTANPEATNAEEDEDDPIVKLQEIEILPDLFTLIHNLQTGTISAKDFDNNAGSIRLKLSNVKQYLSEIDGINETLKTRQVKIDNLKFNNGKKYQFLNKFKSKVINEINNDVEMN